MDKYIVFKSRKNRKDRDLLSEASMKVNCKNSKGLAWPGCIGDLENGEGVHGPAESERVSLLEEFSGLLGTVEHQVGIGVMYLLITVAGWLFSSKFHLLQCTTAKVPIHPGFGSFTTKREE